MSEAVQRQDKDEKGRFLPGNKWMMPRWQKGQSGHTARYTARSLWENVKKYVENPKRQGRLTWAGLAFHLGMSRQALDSYAAGEIGAELERAGIVAVLKAYRTAMEAELEERLTSKDFATQGVIFALKNQAGWRDEKYLNVESQHKQELIVQLPPELAAHLEQQRGEKLGTILEGEIVREPSK